MENKKTYAEDHVLAMFEEIKSQNNLVIEQYSSINEKYDSLNEKYDGLNEKVDLILEDVDEIKSNIVDIKAELKVMNGKIDNKTEKIISDDHENRIVKLEEVTLITG
ncbi:MAG: hypothetical protein UT50_C0001G0080 [Candidatus Moranbacteria bacterium GW2011_GWA2_39_41]|nr:MAG: hypothetical protein UT50_C0001G0080 [Candidatus Moranbacteria bacterium GW2011_GWA2_39_41]